MYSEIVAAREVEIETRADGRRYRTIIWVVTVGDDVFVRSVRGDAGKWYQRAVANPEVALLLGDQRANFVAIGVADDDSVERVSAGFRDKYRPSPSVESMVHPDVLHTTMRLEPI
jgi:hypothetical protein